jgi:23S rRNA (cytosine1962-C5)-methyltransferase
VKPPRLDAALARRVPLFQSAGTDSFRLLNRAADGFPQLAVDRFGPVLVAHLYDGLTAPAAEPTLRALAERVNAAAVYVKRRPAQASTLTEVERAALAPPAPLFGEPHEEVMALENGLTYAIRPAAGLSVGLFPDMRELRSWMRANAAGKTVLNCFAYTCGFGLAATAGGAARAVNIDVSRSALDWGQRNYELNGLTPEPSDFITGDVFDWLGRFARRGQQFDLVILDPPSYSTTRHSRFSVQRDYAALVAAAARLVTRGGWLLACANAAELTTIAFAKQLRAGLADSPARLARLEHEPALDFPRAPGAEPYLKIGFVALNKKD